MRHWRSGRKAAEIPLHDSAHRKDVRVYAISSYRHADLEALTAGVDRVELAKAEESGSVRYVITRGSGA